MDAPDPFIQFSASEFADNPEPRCACVLLIDKSTSMEGDRIAELTRGMRAFADDLRADPLASKRVEVTVIGFGPVEVMSSFQTADEFTPPEIKPHGPTPIGEAVELAIDLLQERKQNYRAHGVLYFRPWIFLVTDGEPTDSTYLASEKIRFGEANKAFAFFAVGVEGAKMAPLAALSVRAPLRLNKLRFTDMFLWLSSSLKSVSQSQVGDEVALENPAGPNGWASV